MENLDDYLLLLALSMPLLSLAAVIAICSCFRKRVREKECGIVQAVREQDRLARELELTRIEKQTLERALHSVLPANESRAEEGQTEPKRQTL